MNHGHIVIPAAVDKKLQKARELVKAGQFGEGLNLYETVVRQFPLANGEYGCAAAHSGDFDLADKIWTRFRTQEQKNAKVLFWLAGQYGAVGLLAKSRLLFREA